MLNLPTFQLIGVGVRTVSFLGIQVYSVALYADLDNPSLKIPLSATPDEKIRLLVENTACVLRIGVSHLLSASSPAYAGNQVPTRTTSYSHLRDGFMRAIRTRLNALELCNAISADESMSLSVPIRKFRALFPTTSFPKHQAMDIVISAPDPSKGPRTLHILNLGLIQDDVIAREFLLAYFEGNGISPPVSYVF